MDYEFKHNYNLRKNNILDFSPLAKKNAKSQISDDHISDKMNAQLGGTPADLAKLNEILLSERTHKQWEKHFICFICLIGMVLVNLLRGSKRFESVIGLERCSIGDWAILLSFFLLCTTITIHSIRKVVYE